MKERVRKLAPLLVVSAVIVALVWLFNSFPLDSGIKTGGDDMVGTKADLETQIADKISLQNSTVAVATTNASTPSASPTSKTLPLTATPTLTPTPGILTEEGLKRLFFGEYPSEHGGNMVGLKLVGNGWPVYDGADWSGDLLCLDSCSNAKIESAVLEASKQNNSSDYWCEWVCQGLYNLFGEWHDAQTDFENARYWFSDPDKEPYCPQFDRDYPEDGEFCNVANPKPTPFPETTLGWPESVKETIVNTWLYPIVSDGWHRLPNRQFLSSNFDHEDLMALPDSTICWVVANGILYHGFPAYLPQDINAYDGYFQIRFKLRNKANRELGESVNGSPPLCPGFWAMIEPAYLP